MSAGAIRRKDKLMSDAEVNDLLARVGMGHIASINADGGPYVQPNLFVHDAGKIYIHTATSGHFGQNVAANPRVSFEAAEMGQIFPYGEFECDTSCSYASVIGFGRVRIESDDAAKSKFFDLFMAKYNNPDWVRPKGYYPRLDDVTVYCIELEKVTGKKGPLPAVSDQWPAKNMTKSPKTAAPKS